MEELVSVIVPVYKVEAYLDQCIGSIVEQTYRNLQIILVDDGSPDRCGQICDSWAAKDDRIQVIHKANGGVSKARNTGLEQATGEWILFVDSDDTIEPEYCRRMVEAAGESNADVVIARPETSSQPKIKAFDSKEIDLLKKTCLAYDETKFGYNIDGPWGKIFRGSLIRKYSIRFPEMLSRSEDAYFCVTFYEYSQRICCLNWFGYCHIEREGSLCRRFSPDAPEMLECILSENEKWIQRFHPGENAYYAALWHRVLPGICECESSCFLHKENPDPKSARMKRYNQFLKKEKIRYAIQNLRFKDIPGRQYRIRLLCYKLGLGWGFLLLKMLRR